MVQFNTFTKEKYVSFGYVNGYVLSFNLVIPKSDEGTYSIFRVACEAYWAYMSP